MDESTTYKKESPVENAESMGLPPSAVAATGFSRLTIPLRFTAYDERLPLAVLETNANLPSLVTAIQQVACCPLGTAALTTVSMSREVRKYEETELELASAFSSIPSWPNFMPNGPEPAEDWLLTAVTR